MTVETMASGLPAMLPELAQVMLPKSIFIAHYGDSVGYFFRNRDTDQPFDDHLIRTSSSSSKKTLQLRGIKIVSVMMKLPVMSVMGTRSFQKFMKG